MSKLCQIIPAQPGIYSMTWDNDKKQFYTVELIIAWYVTCTELTDGRISEWVKPITASGCVVEAILYPNGQLDVDESIYDSIEDATKAFIERFK
jgi:hypothetical protein